MSNTFQKCNKFYKIIFQIMFVGLIILTPLYWAIVQPPSDIFTSLGIYQQYIFQVKHELSLTTRIIALSISLIPTLVVLYILRLFIQIFACYQNLEIFSEKVVSTYKKLGWAFIYWVIAQLIYSPLISFALTCNNPKGQRFISAEMNGTDFVVLLLAGVIMILASVMKKAQNLKAKN